MSTWGDLSNGFDSRQSNMAYSAAAGAPPPGGLQRSGVTNFNDQFPALGSTGLSNNNNTGLNSNKKPTNLSPAAQLAQQLNQSHQHQLHQQSTPEPQQASPHGSQKQNALSILNAIKQRNGSTSSSTTPLPPGLTGVGGSPSSVKASKSPSNIITSTTGAADGSNTAQDNANNSNNNNQDPSKTLADGAANLPDGKKEEKVEEEVELTDVEKYGLRGLLPLLKNEMNDITLLATGLDLNMLGLDMSSKEPLSKTFASPWLETSRSEVEPLFNCPPSFKIDSSGMVGVENRINTFNDETLFFIFYSKPRDILQELVARELNNRNWRYHKDLQVWLTKDSSVEPTPNGPGSEHGTYIFFDPTSWEYVTKEFVLNYSSII
ncbi:unnamed protein product [Ambrosiozyma monospora]|uniref:Unnamed protein product n=1 Tax=Ambrosiozyma monospora TaxID=43982 RepID=A0ACB5T0B7_AMBMO|nr:unnamed protein product [Ambrosiozyma monospora]